VTRVYQADFPAQQPEAQAAPRLPFAHGDQERPKGAATPPRQGPQETQRLNAVSSQISGQNSGQNATRPSDRNPTPIAVERLSVRREFLYVADGTSERKKTLVVQARYRPQPRPAAGAGFTATKKVGGSVIRNRARRRLREAMRMVLPITGLAGVDYVFIARQDTPDCPWPRLLDDMESALLSLRRRIAADTTPQERDPKPPPAPHLPSPKG
jgi:ribonuclease P protein component